MAKGGYTTGIAVATLLVLFSFCPASFAAGVVSNTSESALTAAMAGGGTVTFAVNGTIYLTSTIVVSDNTVLDGTGHNVAISGSNEVQIFIVNADTTLAMTNLTLEDGLAQDPNGRYPFGGGAISNAGNLEVTDCTFTYNSAVVGSNGCCSSEACGGAIYNVGTLQVADTLLENNAALGVFTDFGEVSSAYGGAIYNTGTFTGSALYFRGNLAQGATDLNYSFSLGQPGGIAEGGAVSTSGFSSFVNCIFSNNLATGGGGAYPGGDDNVSGTPGGEAYGGALCNSGSLVVSNNTFALNVATGGQGGMGGSETAYEYVYQGGVGGTGGTSAGGAVCCLGGSSILVNDTFWSNSAVGGSGGVGGAGSAAEPGSYGQDANGGNGGNGGSASGGALCASGGPLLAWNVTVASNSVIAGAGAAGGPGGSDIETTSGSPGSPGAAGIAQGDSVGNLGGTVTLKNSIFVPSVLSETNLFGTMIDAGYNIDSIAESVLTNSTSLNGVNPLLAPLGNYGGPTPTMALLPGSPAIDAADPTGFPATDQRGVPRPFGPAPDIGAFEASNAVIISGQITGLAPGDEATVFAGHDSTTTTPTGAYSLQVDDTSYTITPTNAHYLFAPAFQTINLLSNQTGVNFQAYRLNAITLGMTASHSINLSFAGTNGQTIVIESSANLIDWFTVATNTIGTSSYTSATFPVTNTGQFFRAVSQ